MTNSKSSHQIINFFTSLVVIFISLYLSLQTLKLYLYPPQTLFPTLIAHTLIPAPSPSPSPPPVQPSPAPGDNPPANPPSQQIADQTTIQPAGITENHLWQALLAYRTSHDRTPLIREESLCQYARKRITQHQNKYKENGQTLDNHAGFQADADSGTLFSETGFNSVAEVLAFLPQAQNATEVIEQGWDSSPAHREGLLSNDSTHACLAGDAPFYVGILASH